MWCSIIFSDKYISTFPPAKADEKWTQNSSRMWAGPRNFSSINLKFEHGMRHHRLFFSHHDSWAGGQPHIPLRTNSDQSIILKGFQYSVVPFPFYLCQHFSAELEPSQKTMPPYLWLTRSYIWNMGSVLWRFWMNGPNWS